MNKKLLIILIPFLVSIIFLSGCTEETDQIIKDSSSANSRPIGVISAPEDAYFEESIIFDASDSYDLDGNIVYYSWDFGDEETAEGKTVEHIYSFNKDFEIEYPLIFQISLLVKDNNDSITGTNHHIKISLKYYKFYLDSGKITYEAPSPNEDKIKETFGIIRSNNELTYNLKNSVNISSCNWKINLHIKKPFIKNIRSISVSLYDNNDEVISKADLKFGILEIWRDKKVLFEGKIDKKAEFKSVKISFYGFSFLERIKIIYGGEEPSYLCFDFTY